MSPLSIFAQIVLPVFVLIGLGTLLDRAFKLDIYTLTKVNFYLFTPAMVFIKLLGSSLQSHEVASIVLVALAHYSVMYALSMGLFSLKPFAGQRTVLTFGSIFYNAGNYGFPLTLLAFGEEAVGVIAVVLLVQVVLLYTVGLLLFGAEQEGLQQSLARLFRLPVVYAVPVGLALRALQVDLPDVIAIPLDHVGDGFVAMALLTLGAQLSRSTHDGQAGALSAVSIMRLVVSPLVAAALVWVFQPGAEIGRVLILGAGLPVAVNVYIMANEFQRQADLASRTVFWTTLLSAVTIPLVLMLIR
jgi:hypothetical protein